MRSHKYTFIKSNYYIFSFYSSRYLFRSITRNQYLDDFTRYFSYFNYTRSVVPRSFTSRLKAICVATGRSRALLNKFFLSRMTFKEYAIEGRIFGYKRAQWLVFLSISFPHLILAFPPLSEVY